MEARRVITVDGLAGSGKTALSRTLAEQLGFALLTSGMLYRVVGYLALKAGADMENPVGLVALVKQHQISLELGPKQETRLILDHTDVSDLLYDVRVSQAASMCAKHQPLRDELVPPQREAFLGQHLVAEGRDMGTVIFPKADIKFFIEVPVAVRIQRRLDQLAAKVSPDAIPGLKKDIEIEILERDERDKARTASPVMKAEDAVVVENTGTLTQAVEKMYHLALERGVA